MTERVVTPEVRGELSLPPRPRGLLPAVVILSSSAGVCDVRERFYARAFASRGLAALVVDSFGPRGIVETMTDQSRLAEAAMEGDAYAAYDVLAADGRIDPRRVAVMGVSKGGLAALGTALCVRRAWFSRRRPDFAARVALCPPAHLQQQDARSEPGPVLVLLAGRDDYAGLAPARDYVLRLRAAGRADVSLAVYPEAHHAWERPGPPVWLPDAENYSRCRFLVDDAGGLVEPLSGHRLPLDAFYRRREAFLTRGGHAGGGGEALKARTVADILRFLAKQADFPIAPNPETQGA